MQAPGAPGARPAMPTQTITTERIQQLLEENARLIRAIHENQNAGKLQACAQFQQTLQQNLMYLAAVADAQPAPAPGGAAPPQPQQGVQPQGGYGYQQPQAGAPQQGYGGQQYMQQQQQMRPPGL